MILDYVSPTRVFLSLKKALADLKYRKTFNSILDSLDKDKKLEELGIKKEKDGSMYIGFNLNPELLLYSDTSSETAELKMVAEKMKKYTDFFTVEGILDYMRVDYERVLTDTYYGYVIRLSFNNKSYKRSKFIYDISYLIGLPALLISIILLIF